MLPTGAEFLNLTQSIVIEIQRQSADLYKVQLCNRQFFCGCPSDLRGKGIRHECHPDPLAGVEFRFGLRESKLILSFNYYTFQWRNWFSYLDATRIIARIDSRILAEFLALRLIVFLMNVPLGSPCVYVDMQLEMKPGTKKKIVRNKAIPSRAREPAALSIYAPLRRFHLVVLFTVLWSKMWHSFRMKYLRITQFN